MRTYYEPIMVKAVGDGGSAGAPARFVWRRRLWRVFNVQRCWVEVSPWWDGPQVRRARGQDGRNHAYGRDGRSDLYGPGGLDDLYGLADRGGFGGMTGRDGWVGTYGQIYVRDLLGQGSRQDVQGGAPDDQRRIWRVEAAAGQARSPGVYDLANVGPQWWLQAAWD